MMVKNGQRIQDLIGMIHQLYDPSLAEEWDNVGLQVGDPGAALNRVMVSLDPCHGAVEAAVKSGAQALVTHHPLMFRSVKRLTPEDSIGQLLWSAVRSDLAIISAHTNLDSAVEGLNSWLAKALGVLSAGPLQDVAGSYLKLIVFVPRDHADAVAEAVFSGGAGQIGGYDKCSFRTTGEGTFRPGQETSPFIGEAGKMEKVDELRLETIVPQRKLARVLEKMFRAHPYEEVAYDLVALQNRVPGAGLGRIGTLEEELELSGYVEQIKNALQCDHLRVVTSSKKTVQKVALCGGSGAGLLPAAHRQGADVLVTGDVKYHDARLAEELGVALVDAGHFSTEKIMINEMADTLKQETARRGWDIHVEAYTGEQDPFRVY